MSNLLEDKKAMGYVTIGLILILIIVLGVVFNYNYTKEKNLEAKIDLSNEELKSAQKYINQKNITQEERDNLVETMAELRLAINNRDSFKMTTNWAHLVTIQSGIDWRIERIGKEPRKKPVKISIVDGEVSIVEEMAKEK